MSYTVIPQIFRYVQKDIRDFNSSEYSTIDEARKAARGFLQRRQGTSEGMPQVTILCPHPEPAEKYNSIDDIFPPFMSFDESRLPKSHRR
jgi:hypothetical protein